MAQVGPNQGLIIRFSVGDFQIWILILATFDHESKNYLKSAKIDKKIKINPKFPKDFPDIPLL